MSRIDIYKEDVQTVAQLREMFKALKVFSTDIEVYVRCNTFTDVKSGDIIFGYGSWELVSDIGYKTITLANIDGHTAKCIPDTAFDVKFKG